MGPCGGVRKVWDFFNQLSSAFLESLYAIFGMVRIQGGGGGEFVGRQGSKDMRDRDTAEGRDRGKPRTVANMRERDRTLR